MSETTQPAVERSDEPVVSVRVRRSPKLVRLFLDDLSARLSRLGESVGSGSLEQIREGAHGLRGGVDAVGGTRLSRALIVLENATAASARAAFAQVEVEAETLRAALAKELTRPTDAFERAKH